LYALGSVALGTIAVYIGSLLIKLL
jgi:hypothetical protein